MTADQEYKVVLSSGAYMDLNRHVHFLANVNMQSAVKLKRMFLKDLRSLERMPFRYPYYERPWLVPEKYRHMISASRYRIVYIVEDDTVYVDAVEDC